MLLAVPPEETNSVPPARTVPTVLPRSVCEPPPITVVPLATPARLTTSVPPLTVPPISVPDTCSTPPLSM